MGEVKKGKTLKNIYLYPEAARRKLKTAQEMSQTVYLYGSTGFGKTALLCHYLNRRKYIYLDAATVKAEELEIPVIENPKHETKHIVVVDNLQFAEPEEIREGILKLTARNDVWLLLSGRCRCPSWLLSASLRQYPFMVIEEAELCFDLKNTVKYLELHDIYLEDDEMKNIWEVSRGNGLFLKILVSQMLQHGKQYIYDEEIFKKAQRIFWDYVDAEIYDQWEPGFADFFQQMCVVDSFTIRMAEEISGRRNVEAILQKAFEVGNFLQERNGQYSLRSVMLNSLRRRLRLKYTKEQQEELYYNAGRCYVQEGEIVKALTMFEACGNKHQIRNILIENARTNPGSGYLYELRKYYLALPEEYIMESVELTAGMCMLQSLLLNPQESERWYEILKQKEKDSTGRQRVTVKSWLAYLNIGLPHRGSSEMIELFKSVATLLKNREITLPELSVTSNAPSTMNGGKDFCEWSKRDRELAVSIGKTVSLALGKYGAGFVDLALAESFFEKGADHYEIIRLISKGQMQAESRGKIELCFVAAGLMVNVHILSGNIEDARLMLAEFLEKAEREKAEKLLPNIQNLFCRMNLYQGEKAEIAEWMKTAPGDMEDFNLFERYRYLTKVRVYLLYGKHQMAQALIEKLLYYAEMMNRTYIRMETELLLAILQFRMGYEGWKDTFQKVYTAIESYHFVRLISREGCGVLPLLKAEKWEIKDKKFMEQVLAETTRMAEYYPSYLKEQRSAENTFSENAIRILRMQAEGLSYEQIAEQLKISAATVKYHCRQTYKKLDVSSKVAAVTEARKRKLI